MTALDFCGFGQSAPLREPFSVGDYATWTKKAFAVLGIEKPHCIAHSFGCRVAVKMASADENAFDKLLLTGPAGVVLPRGWKYACKVKAYRFVKKIVPNYAEKHFGSAEYRSLSPLMKESYKKIVNEDLRACAKNVQNQVLLVEGNQDNVTPMVEAKEYLQAFPNAKLRAIDGGHFAFVDNPISFQIIAEEFFYE